MGYIKPYKGILELIKSFQDFFNDDSLLLIVGQVMDKEYFDEIKRISMNKVVIVPKFVPSNEIQFYMNASDIVVLPFKSIENSGSVILAMGFEKTIIAPKIGVLTERLISQIDLLYSNKIEESFEKSSVLRNEDLLKIGKLNYSNLKNYTWRDFSKAFN